MSSTAFDDMHFAFYDLHVETHRRSPSIASSRRIVKGTAGSQGALPQTPPAASDVGHHIRCAGTASRAAAFAHTDRASLACGSPAPGGRIEIQQRQDTP